MSRALYSAVSGLESEQFDLDIIGNNVANTNTTAFKSSRADIESEFSQISREASSSDPIGTFVGLGSQAAGTQTNFSQGSFQSTGLNTDIGIEGSGWLITSTSSTTAPTTSSGAYYTRAGDLVEDSSSYLRTSNGNYVYGVMQSSNAAYTSMYVPAYSTDFSLGTADSSQMNSATGVAGDAGAFGPIRIPTYISVGTSSELVSNFSIGTSGAITVTTSEGTTRVVGYAAIAVFPNNNGLQDQGGGYYTGSSSTSGTPTFYQPDNGPAGSTQSGVLETSNVDLATEFSNMIIAQQGYNANAKVITVSSELAQSVINTIQ